MLSHFAPRVIMLSFLGAGLSRTLRLRSGAAATGSSLRFDCFYGTRVLLLSFGEDEAIRRVMVDHASSLEKREEGCLAEPSEAVLFQSLRSLGNCSGGVNTVTAQPILRLDLHGKQHISFQDAFMTKPTHTHTHSLSLREIQT